MDKNQLHTYCKSLGITIDITKKKGWVLGECPLALWRHKSGKDSNPSFGMYVKPRRTSYAHCFSCGYKGSLMDLVMELKRNIGQDKHDYDFKSALKILADEDAESGLELAYYEEEEEKDPNQIFYFSEQWLSTFVCVSHFEEAVHYLEERGVPEYLYKELGLVYDSDEKRVCFPIRDNKSRLVGLHGRVIDNKLSPPYRMYTDTYPLTGGNNNPQCWYGEEWVDFDYPVVMVESVFDLLRVCQVYPNVVSPLRAGLDNNKLKRMQDCLHVITMFDGDDAGRKGANQISQYFTDIPVKNIELPEGTDPGDLSLNGIEKLLKKYTNTPL